MALRRRWFSVSSSFMRLTWLDLSPPYSWRQRSYVTSVTPIERTASATGVPCATSTSTWRSLDTISSGVCLFLDMGSVLLRLSRAIPQGGPLQWGRISASSCAAARWWAVDQFEGGGLDGRRTRACRGLTPTWLGGAEGDRLVGAEAAPAPSCLGHARGAHGV